MQVNPIAAAIPAFFLLMGVELFVARRRGLRLYRFSDSIADLACGIGQQVVGIFPKAALLGGYAWFFDRFALVRFAEGSPWPWVIAFFTVDFSYYWWHRASHRVNFLWAVHGVHHQSQDYNLAVALRQAWFSGLSSWPFYLPSAFLGIPPLTLATMIAFSTLYQFWIHTETIGRLGAFEWVFNAPSHHRGHHAINPRYIDKNYAATLIVWDRLFGTFVDESERPVYGTVQPYESWNSLWANFDGFAKIGRLMRAARGWAGRLAAPFMPPEWKPGGGVETIPEVDPRSYRKFDIPVSRGLKVYVGVHFVAVTAATTWLLWVSDSMSLARALPWVGAILATLLSWAGLLERRRWGVPFEAVRVAVLAAWAISTQMAR